MSTVAVIGSDVLAAALARQLAVGPATVVLHEAAQLPEPRRDELASLRLLHEDRRRIARDNAALRSWEALEQETGIDMLSPLHAIDVGPAPTIAKLLHAGSLIAPARTLFPAEAGRQWPEIRFDGLVAYQPAACRISVLAARRALLRSAASWGVQTACGRAQRVRTGPTGDAQVLADGTWSSYDAAIVIADASSRSELVGLPTLPDHGTVLSVEPIGAVSDWPSVVHHAGLPADPDGHCIAQSSAEVNDGLLDLTLVDDDGGPEVTSRLWEYATRWLPGTIVNTTRVRTQGRSLAQLDLTHGRLAVTSPLATRDVGVAPVVAAELACDLFNAIDLDRAVARAS